MTCDTCGARCQGRLCSRCEQIELNEKMHGTTAYEDDERPGKETGDVEELPYECAECGHLQVSTFEAGCEECGARRMRYAGNKLSADGGHPPDELVWVRSSSAGCRRDKFHTNPDCRLLARATSKSQKRICVLADDVRPCKVCTGEAEKAGGMPPKSESLFGQLEAADPDDIGDGTLLPDGGVSVGRDVLPGDDDDPLVDAPVGESMTLTGEYRVGYHMLPPPVAYMPDREVTVDVVGTRVETDEHGVRGHVIEWEAEVEKVEEYEWSSDSDGEVSPSESGSARAVKPVDIAFGIGYALPFIMTGFIVGLAGDPGITVNGEPVVWPPAYDVAGAMMVIGLVVAVVTVGYRSKVFGMVGGSP